MGVSCPLFHTTRTTGSASVDACVCKLGYFMNYDNASFVLEDGEEVLTYTDRWCEECPPSSSGYDCTEPGNDLEKLKIQPGFWRSWSLSPQVQKCYHEDFCLGASSDDENATASEAAARRRRLDSHQNTGVCVSGHRGPFCMLCDDNYIHDAEGVCTECTGSVALSFIFPGLIILLVIVLAIQACRSGRFKAIADAAFEANRAGDESMVEDSIEVIKEEVKADLKAKATEASLAAAKSAKEKALGSKLVRSVSNKMQTTATETADRCGCTKKKVAKLQVKARILISLIQVITQLGVVFSIPYPEFYSNVLSWISVLSLDLFEMMPLGCSIPCIVGQASNHRFAARCERRAIESREGVRHAR